MNTNINDVMYLINEHKLSLNNLFADEHEMMNDLSKYKDEYQTVENLENKIINIDNKSNLNNAKELFSNLSSDDMNLLKGLTEGRLEVMNHENYFLTENIKVLKNPSHESSFIKGSFINDIEEVEERLSNLDTAKSKIHNLKSDIEENIFLKKGYETPETTREILNEMYYDRFEFWQRQKNKGVINDLDVSVKSLAIRDNKELIRNPFKSDGMLLDENTKKEWINEMENPMIIESEIPNAQSTLLLDHKDNIENSLKNALPPRKDNEVSYISSQEVKEMLDNHLEQVQDIINNHREEILSLNENKTSLRDNLTESAKNFTKKIHETIQSKKTATKEIIANVRDAGMNKLKKGVIKINESLKDFSKFIDKKLNIESEKNVDDKGFNWYQSKKQNIDLDKIPENVVFIDSSFKSGDVVAYKEPLSEKEMKDNELIPFNKEKDKNNSKTNQKEQENQLEI